MNPNQKFSRQGAKALNDRGARVYPASSEEIPLGVFFFSGQCVKSSKVCLCALTAIYLQVKG